MNKETLSRLRCDYKSVPNELRSERTFIFWKLVPNSKKDNKLEKKPVNPKTMQFGGQNNPECFLTFDEAEKILATELAKPRPLIHGIGIAFRNSSNLLGVDLDKVFDGGNRIKPHAQDILENIEGFVERSVSGTGFHIITRASGQLKNNKNHALGVEIFKDGMFIALTGNEDKTYSAKVFPKEAVDTSILNGYIRAQQDDFVASGRVLESLGQAVDRDLCDDELRDIVLSIEPPDDGYEMWLKVGQAIHYQTGGASEGLDIWKEYSMQDANVFGTYGGDAELAYKWRSFSNKTGRESVTAATLRFFAKKYPKDTSESIKDYAALEKIFPKVVINAEVPRAPNFVIDGFFTDEIFSIAGAPGSGKSSLLFQLAMAAAHLCPEDYELKPLLRRKVVYLTEDSRQAEDIIYGMKHWGGVKASQEEIDEWLTVIEVHRVKPDILGSVIEWKAGYDTVYQNGLNGRVVRVPPLIVFDTAAATFDLENESDNSEVSGAISKVKQACSVTKVPLWIIAHTPKIQRNDVKDLSVRGAGAWTGDVNGTAYVFKDDDGKSNQRYIALGKTRFEPDFSEIEFDTQSHETFAEHELGHTVVKRYRVGLCRKSSEEARVQKKMAKVEEQSEARENEMLLQLVQATQLLLDGSQKTTRIAIKNRVKGKGETKTALLQRLVDDGELAMRKDGTLVLGNGGFVDQVRSFKI